MHAAPAPASGSPIPPAPSTPTCEPAVPASHAVPYTVKGKPENIVEKIAMGKLNKFFKENTLVSQDFIKDSKMSVQQYLQSVDKELDVTSFKRYTLNV